VPALAPKPDLLQLATRYFRLHAWIYGIAAFLALTQILRSVEWWFFWPLMIWTILFTIHFMVFKGQNVSDEWVAERAARATDKAYDVSHIESIRETPTPVSAQLKEQVPADDTEPGTDETSGNRP
jgi:hypothetical protein